MKKGSIRLNEFQASLVITGVVVFLLAIVGLVFAILGEPGWLIGIAVGGAVDFIYLWLMNIGSSLSLKESKAGLFLLTYFLRMIAFVGLFALLVVLQYVLHINVFNNSCWGMLIAFVPVTFVTIAAQLIYKEKEVK